MAFSDLKRANSFQVGGTLVIKDEKAREAETKVTQWLQLIGIIKE